MGPLELYWLIFTLLLFPNTEEMVTRQIGGEEHQGPRTVKLEWREVASLGV